MNKKTLSYYRKSRKKHSKERALQRYGLLLNHDDIKIAIAKISANNACSIRRLNFRFSEWLVEIKGKSVRVLYDKKYRCIATVLPTKEKLTTAA